jgi:DNA primase
MRHNGFQCFACQRRGSVIDLAMMMMSMDFAQACGWLTDRYLRGNRSTPPRLPQIASMPAPAAQDSQVAADPDVYDWLLDQSALRSAGRAYLINRGISAATIDHFRVGQVATGEALLSDALKRFGTARLERVGLLSNGRRGVRLVFPSGYLLFPFLKEGRVVYIQARRADEGRDYRWICPAKLLPPPYNLDVLDGPAATITICEGITDVLSAHEMGMAPIGLLGAARDLPPSIIDHLVGRNVAIFSDADRAGTALAQRLRRRLAPRGITVLTKRLPPGINDLNDYLQSRRAHA